ncbi:MAG: flagellar basal body P-ring formation protein FlgA [Magnetococcales bacterium]|nr:flagellar basal body P-ring formation protein FlgA [Magnetococcales bacterium]
MKRPLFAGCFFGVVALLVAATGFSQVVARTDVMSGVSASLGRAFAKNGSGLVVEKIFQRTDITVADGSIVWQIDTDLDDMKPGRRSIPVTAMVNGVPDTQIKVVAVIKRYLKIPVVRRSIKRGSMVTAKDLKMKRMEMVREIDGLVVNSEDIIGMVAKRKVSKWTPLQMKWFAEQLAVERGDRVMVRLIKGGLRINTTAEALADGRVGEMIQLRNPKSHVRYEARISAPGQAMVQTW